MKLIPTYIYAAHKGKIYEVEIARETDCYYWVVEYGDSDLDFCQAFNWKKRFDKATACTNKVEAVWSKYMDYSYELEKLRKREKKLTSYLRDFEAFMKSYVEGLRPDTEGEENENQKD